MTREGVCSCLCHSWNGKEQAEWMRNHAPIVVQPLLDIRNGNEFVCTFYQFFHPNSQQYSQQAQQPFNQQCECESEYSLLCDLALVYSSEATYNAYFPHCVNQIGTFFYRSFNQYHYARTSDVNHLRYHLISSSTINSSKAVHSDLKFEICCLASRDFSGQQSWAKGNKRTIGVWSFVHHYHGALPISHWQLLPSIPCSPNETALTGVPQSTDIHLLTLEKNVAAEASALSSSSSSPAQFNSSSSISSSSPPVLRPVVYVNTANHLMWYHFVNSNTFPRAALHYFLHYPLCPGNSSSAESFARSLPLRPTVFTVLQFLLCGIDSIALLRRLVAFLWLIATLLSGFGAKLWSYCWRRSWAGIEQMTLLREKKVRKKSILLDGHRAIHVLLKDDEIQDCSGSRILPKAAVDLWKSRAFAPSGHRSLET